VTSVIHLVAGSTGAGKTTFAIQLAEREKALRLSIDEWMVTLFEPDQPAEIRFEWMIERVNRCEAQMWDVALQAAAFGQPIIVDCGPTSAADRDKWVRRAAAAGLPVRLHFLDVDAEERWRRVQERNAQLGPTYRLHVTREMFDFVETLWEAPGDAELTRLNGVRLSGRSETSTVTGFQPRG
jgi:predicted kinase